MVSRWLLLASLFPECLSFLSSPSSPLPQSPPPRSPTARCAKPTPSKKRGSHRANRSCGFGGASVAPCPCGSGAGYGKCCGRLHGDPRAFAAASAAEVVRARYSAYAKRDAEFLVGSTHPLHREFVSDVEGWKERIRGDCYDDFELTGCEILEESYDGQSATVRFVARMTQVGSRGKTAFMETSTFERAGNHADGAWLYKEGVIEAAPEMPMPEMT